MACLESASHVKSTKQLGIFSFPSGKPCHRHLLHRVTWEAKSRKRRWLTGRIPEGTMLDCVTNSLTPCTQRSTDKQQHIGQRDQHLLPAYNIYVCCIHACMCLLSTHAQPHWLDPWAWSCGSLAVRLLASAPRNRQPGSAQDLWSA